MTNLQAQLEQLFELEKQLNDILDNEEYEQFQLQQAQFSEKVEQLLSSHSQQTLSAHVQQLKRLEDGLQQLQDRALLNFNQLKEKSLLLRRNKSKIQAYK